MTALFELATQYRAIADKLHDSELDEQTINDTLEGMSGDLQEKSINIAKFFRNVESDADQIEQAAKQMIDRAKSMRKKADSLKHYLHSNMEKAGIQKIESPWFVLSIKNNPESVQIDSEDDIPDVFMRVIPEKFEPNKAAMKSAMQEGIVIPGARLTRTTRLEIK